VRPDDVADWEAEDYYDAKFERDRRFTEAVQYVGDYLPDDAEAAVLLTRLLRAMGAPAPEASPPSKPDVMGGLVVSVAAAFLESEGTAEKTQYVAKRSCRPKEVQALVTALMKCQTAPARRAVEEIATGRFPTDDDGIAIETVLNWAVEHPSDETEKLLYGVLTAQWPTPVTTEARKAAQRRDRAVTKMLEAATLSREVRSKLAELVSQNPKDYSYGEEIIEGLSKAWLANVPAQMTLLEKAGGSSESRATLTAYFAAYRSAELARLTQISPGETKRKGARAGGRVRGKIRRAQDALDSVTTVDPAVAAVLNSDRLEQWVASRLYCANSLSEDGVILALAGTLPTREVRESVRSTLLRNWPDGPQGLRDAGLPDMVFSEPGFLVELKSAQREWRRKIEQQTSKRGTPSARTRSQGRSNTSKANNAKKPTDPWTSLIEDIEASLCERLYDASQRGEIGPPAKGRSEKPIDLPIPLHKNARIVHQCQRTWPDPKAGGKGAMVPAPMKLRFVRCDETIMPDDLVSHYKSRDLLVGASGKNRLWLTNLDTDKETGWRRSIDVRIELTGDKKQAARGVPVKLAVSVLVIEIPAEGDAGGADKLTEAGRRQ
jgi:hypothetical protein